jgi:hypothetical protein
MLLMTIGGLMAAGVMFVIALCTKRAWLAKFVVGGVLIWFCLYIALLFVTSFLSEEKVLSVGEPKAFCGFYLDCHMHASLGGVRKAKSIGDPTAKGELYIVTVNVFSDAARVNLRLHTVDAHVVDAEGREYTRVNGAESELGPQPAFETEIGSEESFDKEIVFDLPVDVMDPRLDISQALSIDSYLRRF